MKYASGEETVDLMVLMLLFDFQPRLSLQPPRSVSQRQAGTGPTARRQGLFNAGFPGTGLSRLDSSPVAEFTGPG